MLKAIVGLKRVGEAGDHHLPGLLPFHLLECPLECPFPCGSPHFEILVLKRGCILTPVLAAICVFLPGLEAEGKTPSLRGQETGERLGERTFCSLGTGCSSGNCRLICLCSLWAGPQESLVLAGPSFAVIWNLFFPREKVFWGEEGVSGRHWQLKRFC